jgi:hypothetical protein
LGPLLQDIDATWGRPIDALPHPQLLGHGDECLPGKGKQRPAFQGRSRRDSGGTPVGNMFDIIVNAVVPEWMRLMRDTLDYTKGNIVKCIEGIFAVFYINDGFIVSCNAEFLQEALDIFVKTFKHVSLATYTKKMQALVCMPGKIRVQLATDLYRCMCKGVAAGEEPNWAVVCHMCNKTLQARSLCLHLSSTHDIHQQVVVADALLEEWAGARYRADPGGTKEPIQCRSQDARGC